MNSIPEIKAALIISSAANSTCTFCKISFARGHDGEIRAWYNDIKVQGPTWDITADALLEAIQAKLMPGDIVTWTFFGSA